MSKSRGNVVEPRAIINNICRCSALVLSHSAPRKCAAAEDQVAEITCRFQLILWNVYSFFIAYANIDNYSPKAEVDYS
jgi:isoleucyl-tRNA synthetase